MGLFDLVEQHDGVGVTSYPFGQLSALLIAYVSRRCTNESRGVETLRVLTHIDTDQCISTAEHKLCQFLGEIGLTHTRRTEEHKHTDGMVGVFQSDTVTLDGLHHLVDGGILGNDGILQRDSHTLQTDTLLFSHPLGRHTRHHRNDFCHLFSIYHLTLFALAGTPTFVQEFQLRLEHRLTVTVAGSQLEVLVLHRQLLLLLDAGDLFLLLRNLRRYLGIAEMHARPRLVEGIDGLVGHKTVCHITVCQFDTRYQCLVSIGHVVMMLITVLDVSQDL